MADQNFDRHKGRMNDRLIEQIKTFNKKLLIQIINTMFFIVILLPFIIGTVIYLLGTIFSNAATFTHANTLISIKDTIWVFVSTNSMFHCIIGSVVIIVLILMCFHFFNTRVSFNSKELDLASFILAKVKQNQVTTYNMLRKEP
ncbi:MAG: hypothetical protein AB7V50_11755 [Vampirovibrionia bacterium]